MKKVFLIPLFAVGFAGLPCHAAPLLAESLTLAGAEQQALERNRSVNAARRGIASADAGVDSAAATPNPTLTLGASNIDTQRGVGAGGLRDKKFDRLLRIDQPIERGGKRDLRVAVAEAQRQAAGSDLADAERQQVLAVRSAYFDLKLAQDRAAALDESARLAAQTLAKAELRFKAGDLSGADVARIRTDSLRTESDAQQAQIDLSRSRLALAQLLAAERQAARLNAVDPWPKLALIDQGNSDEALAQRPDVVSARQRLTAAEETVRLAEALRSRDVSVGAQFELDPRDGRHLLSLGVSIPLFLGNDYRGEIAAALVNRDGVREELERIEAMARADVDLARSNAERSVNRARRLQEEALPSARRAYAALRLAFEQGAASALDLMDARRALLAAELDVASARADAAKAQAQLAAALNVKEMP